jgi:osmotically-inducible protein OsmY
MKSDEQLQLDVLAALRWDPRVQSSQIGVMASHGAVTLTGRVSSYAEKLAAQRAAQRVEGVTAIADEIQIKLAHASTSSDDSIAERIANILKWNVSLRDSKIQAQVDQGHVTLTGEVEWPYQKQMAAHRVEELQGVLGIHNELRVRRKDGTLTAEHVKAQILAALQRHAMIEASRIHVSVMDGKVALEGIVNAVYERELIEDAVWCTAGVQDVVDQLTIR